MNLIAGEEGILKKAENAQIKMDIQETKEQIQLEILGNTDDKTGQYTNNDVISAIKKVTGYDVVKNTEKVKSKKGNDVDISDFWLTEITFNFGDLEVTLPGVMEVSKAMLFWMDEWKEEVLENCSSSTNDNHIVYSGEMIDDEGESCEFAMVFYPETKVFQIQCGFRYLGDSEMRLNGVKVNWQEPIVPGAKYTMYITDPEGMVSEHYFTSFVR